MFPFSIKSTGYMTDKPYQKIHFAQTYSNINFNIEIEPDHYFNTSLESLSGYEIRDMMPE
jgi:hypothetical protein